ncbi:carph-isopro domain-containing protein [Albimonas pacifica]
MSNAVSPVDVVVSLFGSPGAVAEVCDRHRTAVSHWRRAGPRREAGDVPPPHMRKLLAHARAHGIPLTAEHLIFGATRAELEILLDRRNPDAAATPAASVAAE